MKKHLKLFLIVILLAASSITSSAQKIELKKGQVVIDSKPVLRYTTNGWTSESVFYSLRTENMILRVQVDHSQYGGHVSIEFPQNNISFDSQKILYGMSPKPFLQKLIKQGVLTTEGEINYEKAEQFRNKYATE
jgi:hypothetical protein